MNSINYILKSSAVFTGLQDAPFSGAVAVSGNKIAGVCRGSIPIEWEADADCVYDLKDSLIMAGFSDAHVHFFMGAVTASPYVCTEIMESTSQQQCLAMVKAFADSHPDLDHISGMGWFPANWNNAPLPTKEALDAIIPDRPVYLLCADGHTYWLNSKALEFCGITEDSTVSFGAIGKDDQGQPNGLLFEIEACVPCNNQLLNLPDENMRQAQKDCLKQIAELGITSICDMAANPVAGGDFTMFEIARELEQSGALTARLHLYPSLGLDTDYSVADSLSKKYHSGMLRVAGLKQFVDGVTSTYTGYLLEPYSDRPDTCGASNYPPELFNNCVAAANSNGYGVRLHAIGDAAVRLALDAFEYSRKSNCRDMADIHNSIEHIESIHPSDISRFAELDVIASVQPYHLVLDYNEKLQRIGKERCRYEWPFRTMLDHNAVLAFGTDFPVISMDPFVNIYAAVTRCDDHGVPTGINPEEKITMAETLKAYTLGGAQIHGRQKELGTLEEGKLADITVIDKNLFTVPETEIPNCNAIMTIVDGKIVFKK